MTAWILSPTGKLLRRIKHNVTAGIGVIAALALPAVVGAGGLAFDVNRGLDQRSTNQRVADMGALSAAMAYKTAANTTQGESLLQPTAIDIALANRLSGATVTAVLVNDIPNAGDKSVKVTVSSTVPFTLAKAVQVQGSYTVTTEAYATLSSTTTTTTTSTTTVPPTFAAPCFLALSNTSDALVTSGGATINASNCSVAAVGSINAGSTGIAASDIISGSGSITNNYGYLTANSLRYSGSFNNPAWNAAVPTSDKRVNASTTLTDPWAGNTDLATAYAGIGQPAANPAAPNPSCPTDWNFDWNHAGAVSSYWVASPAASPNNYNYIVPAGTHCINNFTVAGGLKVLFQTTSTSTVSVSGAFNVGGGSGVVFGDGAIQFKPIVTVAGGSTVRFGNGTHAFGGFDLGGGGSVTMGTGDFTAAAGVKIAGDTELSIGNGNVAIGSNASGNAIDLGGSARFFMGNGTFTAKGNVTTQGGSKLVFGTTANHQINGNLNVAGAVLFGDGRYTINGNFTNSTGGTTWPYTSALNGTTYGSAYSGYDQGGTNVTFIANGTMNLAGGAKTKLIAATTSTTGGAIANMLLYSKTSSATSWSAGSGNVFVGTVYLPNSTVTMSGGSTTLSNGQCFSLIASKIVASGGAAAGTSCPEMSGAIAGNSTTTTTTSTNSVTSGVIKLVR